MLLLYSCKKGSSSSGCEPTDTTYYYITATDKSYIPYTGHDTIKLQYNGGQVVSFIGQGRDSGYDQRYALQDPACPLRFLEYLQYYSTKYTSVNYSLPLYIIENSPASSAGTYINIKFDNKIYSTGASGMGYSILYKTLIINGKQYKAFSFRPPQDYDTDSAYFSKDYGIVKIYSQGVTWTISQ